jgi:DNA replication protein DnaC
MDCGAPYEELIYVRRDGSELAPDPRCRACSSVYDHAQRAEAHRLEVLRADTEKRQEWKAALAQELEEKFRAATFDTFVRTKQPAAFKAMSTWDGQSLVLTSPPGVYGVGKTHLAAALANRLTETSTAAVSVQGSVVRLPRPCAFTTEPLLMDRIRATFNDGARETDEEIYLQLERVRLLIIDDVGKRTPRDLSFTQQVWFRIIDGRYRAQRPLVLTTNLLPNELDQHIGGACADRLMEMCGASGLIAMKGTSYRRRL